MKRNLKLKNVGKSGMTKWLLDNLRKEDTLDLIFIDPKVEITEESLALLPEDIKEIFRLSLQSSD